MCLFSCIKQNGETAFFICTSLLCVTSPRFTVTNLEPRKAAMSENTMVAVEALATYYFLQILAVATKTSWSSPKLTNWSCTHLLYAHTKNPHHLRKCHDSSNLCLRSAFCLECLRMMFQDLPFLDVLNPKPVRNIRDIFFPLVTSFSKFLHFDPVSDFPCNTRGLLFSNIVTYILAELCLHSN